MFLKPEENIESFGLKEGDIVADFGAGSGTYAYLAAKIVGETGKVYAVEVQRDFLPSIKSAAASQGLPNVEVIWGDFEILGGSKLRDAVADTVILANTLFQLEDKKGAAKEAKRVLKPKGRVVVIDWQESFGNMGPAKDHVVTSGDAKRIFGEAGFIFEKEIPAGEYHYGMVFRN
ncbi:methyltransferase domain-containing protein [bacterium]|nr:methyltransferase domain-containing protein [bacterium]